MSPVGMARRHHRRAAVRPWTYGLTRSYVDVVAQRCGAGTGGSGSVATIVWTPVVPTQLPSAISLASTAIFDITGGLPGTELAVGVHPFTTLGRHADGTALVYRASVNLTLGAAESRTLRVYFDRARTTTDIAVPALTYLDGANLPPASWMSDPTRCGQPAALAAPDGAGWADYLCSTGWAGYLIPRSEAEALDAGQAGTAIATHNARFYTWTDGWWWDQVPSPGGFAHKTLANYPNTAPGNPAGTQGVDWQWWSGSALRPPANKEWREASLTHSLGGDDYYGRDYVRAQMYCMTGDRGLLLRALASAWRNGYEQYFIVTTAGVAGTPTNYRVWPMTAQPHVAQPVGHALRYSVTGDPFSLDCSETLSEWLHADATGWLASQLGSRVDDEGEPRPMERMGKSVLWAMRVTRPTAEGTPGVNGVERRAYAARVADAVTRTCAGTSRSFFGNGDQYWHQSLNPYCNTPADPANPTQAEYGWSAFQQPMVLDWLWQVKELAPQVLTAAQHARIVDVTQKTLDWLEGELRQADSPHPSFRQGFDGDCVPANYVASVDLTCMYWSLWLRLAHALGSAGGAYRARGERLLKHGVGTPAGPLDGLNAPFLNTTATVGQKISVEQVWSAFPGYAYLKLGPARAAIPTDVVATVTVAPASLSLQVTGAATTATATAKTAAGYDLSTHQPIPLTYAWGSSNPAVFTVSGASARTATVTPAGAGTADLTCSVNGVAATAVPVTVAAPQLDESWETQDGALWAETNTGTGNSAVAGTAGARYLEMSCPAASDVTRVDTVAVTYDHGANRRWWAEVEYVGTVAQQELVLRSRDAGGDGYGLKVVNGNLQAGYYLADVQNFVAIGAYNATTHRFLGFVDTGTNALLQASADGVTWSTVHTVAPRRSEVDASNAAFRIQMTNNFGANATKVRVHRTVIE